MTNLYRTVIATTFLSFYVVGCTHESKIQTTPSTPTNNNPSNPNNPGTGNPINPADTALCFERDILPIFLTNCAKSGCHDAASRQEGFVFTNWQTITSKDFEAGDPDDTELYEKITENDPSDRMPPPPNPPLTTHQKELIRRWIREGAKNTTNCKPICDSNKFTYAADIRPIADKYCVGCHTGASASKGIQLDTYEGLRNATLGGRLLDAINHRPGITPMPQNGAKLSNCEIKQIEKWAAAGAPNN